jgi:hypothetical protein
MTLDVAYLNARWVAHLHTIIVCSVFVATLILGWLYHWSYITSNAYFQYPLEWFPSISATIGDYALERIVFHYGMALSATPRMLLAGLVSYYYYMNFGKTESTIVMKRESLCMFRTSCFKNVVIHCLPLVVFGRTLSAGLCGMVSYIVFSLLLYILTITTYTQRITSHDDIPWLLRSYFWKQVFALSFFIQLICGAGFLYAHRVLKLPGGKKFISKMKMMHHPPSPILPTWPVSIYKSIPLSI